ncbi:hypothetical protein AB0J43_26480, partial [Nonomuraea fuscirosea]
PTLLGRVGVLVVDAGGGPPVCGVGGEAASLCSQRLSTVSAVSGLFAVLAACCTVAAWLLPWPRHQPQAFARLMGAGVLAWVVAEGVLFLGGLLVR